MSRRNSKSSRSVVMIGSCERRDANDDGEGIPATLRMSREHMAAQAATLRRARPHCEEKSSPVYTGAHTEFVTVRRRAVSTTRHTTFPFTRLVKRNKRGRAIEDVEHSGRNGPA